MGCNKLSADVWNYCVKIDKEHKEQTGKQMKFGELQSAVKDFNSLSSKNIQMVFMKYYHSRGAMWNSIKAKHENSSKVRMPYKEKKYFNTMWDFQAMHFDGNTILLNKSKLGVGGYGKRQAPIRCKVKSLPPNIVEVELLYRKGLKLAIKYKEPDIEELIQSDNAAAIDLGEIHSITSIDKEGHALIITGRKLRSIKRLRNKEWRAIRNKQSKCIEGSKRYNKYKKAMYNLKINADNQIKDIVHKISDLYLRYCLNNCIKLIYYGDVDTVSRNSKGRVRSHIGAKLNQWNHGQIVQQLENKLNRHGIKLVKVSEAYSTQKCPYCGNLHKTNSRNYSCKCGYTQHRDIVGAMNILNDNAGTKVNRYVDKTYLRIV